MINQINRKLCKLFKLFTIVNHNVKRCFYFRSKFEAIPDNLTPDEIFKQAQNAAKIASQKLTTKNTKVL